MIPGLVLTSIPPGSEGLASQLPSLPAQALLLQPCSPKTFPEPRLPHSSDKGPWSPCGLDSEALKLPGVPPSIFQRETQVPPQAPDTTS